MPLIVAPQGQHNWWTTGLGGSRRTLRNLTGGWTTAKSVAQEGRKGKTMPPPPPSLFTDRKTSRTDLTSLKPAEEFIFLFKFLLLFCPSFFFLFLLPSFFILYSFFVPSFVYFYILIFIKIPSSFHSSDLFYSLFLLSLLSFSIPFSFPQFFFLPPFTTGETIKPRLLKRPELDPVRPINVNPRPVSSGGDNTTESHWHSIIEDHTMNPGSQNRPI